MLSQEQITKELYQIYENPIKIKNNSTNKETISLLNQDKAADEIAKMYEKKSGIDFQKYLKDKVVPMAGEKLQRDIGDDIQKEKNEEEKTEVVKQINKTGVAADEKTLKKVTKTAEKKQKDGQEVDMRSEILKAIYFSTLEEYHELRKSLYEGTNGQISTGNMTPGYKMGAKLVLYQNYIRKLDIAYKAHNGSFICQDDDKIKEKESLFLYKDEKSQKIVNEKVEDKVQNIEQINNKIEEITDKISNLSDKAGEINPEEFNKKMDFLQGEYISNVVKLNYLNPDFLDMQRQAKDLEVQEEFQDRILGNVYEKKHDAALGNNSVYSKKKSNKENNKENLEDISTQIKDFSDININTAQDQIVAFKTSLSKGVDYESLEEIIESAEMMTGIDAHIKEEEKNTDQRKNNGMTEKKEKLNESIDFENPLIKECKDSIEPNENIIKKDVDDLKTRQKRVQTKINERSNNEQEIKVRR
ncbi:MAG: hypothetical protein RSB67_04020 [Clostridia bacterium]